jgi:hypothetical protein
MKDNPKQFWSFLNLKRNSGTIPSLMTYNDDSLNNAQQVADSFSDYISKSFTCNNSVKMETSFSSLNVNSIHVTSITESPL